MSGDRADLEVPVAAAAIVETLHGLTMADSGKFLRWDGTEHPW